MIIEVKTSNLPDEVLEAMEDLIQAEINNYPDIWLYEEALEYITKENGFTYYYNVHRMEFEFYEKI